MSELRKRLYDMANHKIVILPNHARHILYEAADRIDELEAEVKLLKLLNRKNNEAIGFAVSRVQAAEASEEKLREVIRKAPCSQDSIPCMWPCGHDPDPHGPCWKQIALEEI